MYGSNRRYQPKLGSCIITNIARVGGKLYKFKMRMGKIKTKDYVTYCIVSRSITGAGNKHDLFVFKSTITPTRTSMNMVSIFLSRSPAETPSLAQTKSVPDSIVVHLIIESTELIAFAQQRRLAILCHLPESFLP